VVPKQELPCAPLGGRPRKKIPERSLQGNYEPSNIWQTRNSAYWQWRQVSEWFKDQEKDSRKELKIYKQLETLGIKL